MALIALLVFGGISLAQPVSWEVSFLPGGTDSHGNFIGGTEIRDLVPWNPGTTDAKLYAANGYWMDNPGPEGYQNAQVLVLNSSQGEWQQDVSFGEGDFCPAANPKCALATAALDLLFFSSDENLTPVNVQVLVASTWDISPPPVPVNVFAKNNSDHKWYKTELAAEPKPDMNGTPQVRSFGTHVDRITGYDWAFAGESPTGIFHGLLSSNRAGGHTILNWFPDAEFNPSDYRGPPCQAPFVRVTTFAEAVTEAGTKVYASVCHQIYERVDGYQQNCRPDQVSVSGACQPRWKVFWTDPEPSYSETGLRGLTKISYQGKDVLLVAGEGYLIHIYRIDPDTGVADPELDVINFVSNQWNLPVDYTITSYNRMPL